MDKTQEKSKMFGIFYDNGEMGKHQVKTLGEEQFTVIEEAHEFLDGKGYFQLNEMNPFHFVKDSTNDFGLAFIIEL